MARAELKALQDAGNWTELMVRQEQVKMLPIGDVWEEYCRQCGTDDDAWFDEVMRYEAESLSQR